jgi:hypothetical protein
MILFRPVGLEELRLVFESSMRRFPPRLPEQPIFYPVTTLAYAQQIARDWNTTSGSRAGFVTRVTVDDAWVSKFERRIVGSREHEELWVPAEELDDFNARLEGLITVVDAYFGEPYAGEVPTQFGLKGKSATEQLLTLARHLDYSGFDVGLELVANKTAVFLNYPFWQQHDFAGDGLSPSARDAVLAKLAKFWTMHESLREIPLGLVSQT